MMIQPADRNLTTNARMVLAYLAECYGKVTLAGNCNHAVLSRYQELSGGRAPAISNEDLNGWHADRENWIYRRNIERDVEDLRQAWDEDGSIPTLTFHWGNPLNEGGQMKDSQEELTPQEWDAIITDGTPENKTLVENYLWHMRFLEPLVKHDIPILWRPLHEIDGSWFWWNCEWDASKTAELWRILFRLNTEVLGYHNLIYLWAASERNPHRFGLEALRPYYPGSEYVDITGIDLYKWNIQTGIRTWGKRITFRECYDMVKAVDPTKMVALCECQGFPNPEPLPEHKDNFAPWLWALPWWVVNEKQGNPAEWVQYATRHYRHSLKEPFGPIITQQPVANGNRISVQVAGYPEPTGHWERLE